MDCTDRIKLADVESGQIREVVNSQEIGYAPNETNPVVLLFTDWLASAR